MEYRHTNDGEWMECELLGLLHDECLVLSKSYEYILDDKSLRHPKMLRIAVMEHIQNSHACLVDVYNDLGDGEPAFTKWAKNAILEVLDAHKLKSYK